MNTFNADSDFYLIGFTSSIHSMLVLHMLYFTVSRKRKERGIDVKITPESGTRPQRE